MVESEDEYKVVRLLDELLPEALRGTPSGARLDVRLYFREKPDGSRWGEVVLVDPISGNALHDATRSIPLDSPKAIKWYFGVIADKAFPLAVERRTKPRAEA